MTFDELAGRVRALDERAVDLSDPASPRLLAGRRCRVVGIDGLSGSGKSSFAARLAGELSCPVLAVDDLVPGWDAIAESISLLAEGVLRPLAAGRPARWQQYDWLARRPGAWVDLDSPDFLVVEGCCIGLEPAATGATELTPEFLVASGLDATFGGYWSWDALTADPDAAEQVRVWPMRDTGAPRYHSYVLGAHESSLSADPDLARSFLAATARGYAAAAAEQGRTVRLLAQTVPYVSSWRLARSLSLVAPTWFHDGRWGGLRADLVQEYAAFLAAYGILAAPETWPAAITAEFLPPGWCGR